MPRSASLAVVAALAAWSGYGCNDRQATAPPQTRTATAAAREVELGKVELRAMPRSVTLLGNVVADRQSEVAANVAGQVVLAPIERGQRVRAGETLILVDSKGAKLTASAATSQAQLADEQARQARADCVRAQTLLSEGALGKADYDRQHTQCSAQQLQADAARAQAALTAKLVADALVRAPFAGVIGERYVNAGEYVQPNTKVAALYSLDPVRVVISVPEQDVGWVRKGTRLRIEAPAYPERSIPAEVEYVSPVLRMQQRDRLVEARAPNPEGLLLPGMFATVRAALGEEQLVTVPDDAIVVQGDVRRLFLVRDGRAFELIVQTGATVDDRTAVYAELTPDTLVIRHPHATLRDGALVASSSGPPPATTHTATVQR